MRAHLDGQRVSGRRTPAGTSCAVLLIGAAVLLGAPSFSATAAQAQSALPPVTVEAPAPRPKAARASDQSPRRAQTAARQRNRNPAPAAPTLSERAAAEAAAQQAAKLGYRAMPSATTLRSGASPLDTSQAVNVVPEQVLKDQLPRNIDDALINVSGITQTNTLAGSQDAVIRRGFGDNRDGSIMRNGMPLVQGRSFNPAVESVEVLKGPASLLYGIMDPGGIVNTISKRPELYQHGSVTLLGSAFSASKTGADGLLDITGPIGDQGLAYRFIGYGVSEDYWRNFGRHREMLVAPSLAWYGQDTTVQLNYEHREFIYPFDRGTAFNPVTKAPLAVPKTRRLDEPFNNTWGTSDLIQASVEHRFNQDWKLYAGYSYNTETFSANQLRITGINFTTGAETRSNDGTQGSLSNASYGTSYVSGGFWLGEMRNDVVFGGDGQYRTIYRDNLIRQTTPAFNVYNPVYGLIGPGTTGSNPDSAQTDKLGQWSIFVQDTLHLTERFALVGGVRYMDYDQIAGRGKPFVTNTNVSQDKMLPLGGAIFKLTDQISLYASYTESLKPNSTIAPIGVTIGSNVAPEEGVSYETGVKFDLNKRISGTLALYDLDKKNVQTTKTNSAGVVELHTVGRAHSRGVELDVTGRLTDSWALIGSYGYTDARVTASEDVTLLGRKLQNVALNTASLYLVYDFGTALPGQLRLGGGARYVGDRPGDSINSFFLPPYVVADIFATYEMKYQNTPVIYQLNVKNLFDTVYYPSAVNNLNVALGDARRVSLSATVKF
ncbi:MULTISPECIES: TonB-dependent siderophore receptor [Bradyrhizobium]|uniref:TonB-dependent siderophore receptor n=1 Tax=Bradyrhizobium canariense TaxID=255045 RepID=A0A1X3H293_9BRAD|nr:MULTISPECIES: TonB-dependent siderophore receptor [Bradyrhizobium]OSI67625.1 TonB-dependent siderophore receptor [Bradyrhizobium canariense]OSI71678.1 TonB-dependent siderophore receptor [Bradyrhizobium canariense]OSI77464.1 TonB-dependent siderophore receptor [Bradyrhizobium canariense]OSI87355.1 TonB-dependent siderophore receptor [Bradyrhizobium canariense]OSI88550.1 TonB-dependent siderophore receptor [Bradyrhizobium canariense]